MSWKVVPGWTEAIFPGILSPQKHYGQSYRLQTTSSLPLQVVLYFNVWFYPVWLVTTVVMTAAKIHCLSNLYRFIAVTVQVSIACIEVLRLYLGYFGNLSEKIPEVAAFWMLSVLLQFPLQIFLTVNPHLMLEVIQFCVQGIMLIMLTAQLIIGFHALRVASRTQAARFHMMQMQGSHMEQREEIRAQ